MSYMAHFESADGLTHCEKIDGPKEHLYREIKDPLQQRSPFEGAVDQHTMLEIHAREYRLYSTSGQDLYYIEVVRPQEKSRVYDRQEWLVERIKRLPDHWLTVIEGQVEVLETLQNSNAKI